MLLQMKVKHPFHFSYLQNSNAYVSSDCHLFKLVQMKTFEHTSNINDT